MKKYTEYIISRTIISLIVLCAFMGCEKETNVRDGIREVTFKATANTGIVTVGETITYYDSSLNVSARLWTFENGSIPTSDQQTVDVSYDTPSLNEEREISNGFLTKLEVTHTDGSVESNAFKVKVYPRIDVKFGTDKVRTFSGSSITFVDSSEYTLSEFEDPRELDSYQWEFPGGVPATSREQNPTVTYPETGVFDVKLTVHREAPGDDVTEVREDYITITEPVELVPAFTSDRMKIEAGETVNFMDATEGEPSAWTWSFPGGEPETSTVQNPSVTYTEEGVYDVSLEVRREIDGAVKKISEIAYITVGAASSPFCDTPDNLVGCGNNDGEGADLSDWNAMIASDDASEPKDRNDRLSISTEQAFAGEASIKYSYSEPGAAAFTDVLIDYEGKMVNVTEAGSYTLSMENYGVITGGNKYVFLFGLVNENGAYNNQFIGQYDADQWINTTRTFDLEPGQYHVRIQVFNPGFNPTQSIDLYMDEIKVVKN